MNTKNKITELARSWLGTRFIHRQSLMKNNSNFGGSDCLGFIISISKELNLITKDGKILSDYELPFYSYNPKTNLLKDFLDQKMIKIPYPEEGSICLFSINEWPVHIALVARNNTQLTLIHQLRSTNSLVEHSFNESWQKRLVGNYIFLNMRD